MKIYHSKEREVTIKEIISQKAEEMSTKHSQRVVFELDFDSSESLARVDGMGFTIDFLKWINGIKANWYSFQGTRDQTIFILLYPLSVSFCYIVNDLKNVFDFVVGKGRE